MIHRSRAEADRGCEKNDKRYKAVGILLFLYTGLSPEEYYDHFDAMLKEHPEILGEILEKGLREQRKRFENE